MRVAITFVLIFLFMPGAGAAPASDRLSYFCGSYEKCRTGFRDAVVQATQALSSAERAVVETGSWKVPSESDGDLSIDWVYFPPTKGQRTQLVVLTSGVHGVEGFAGSAMQQLFLRETLPTLQRDNLGILVVHAINPYGFKYIRRVSEHNVDLNRNFDINKLLFASRNEGYRKLNAVLNPVEPFRGGLWTRLKFYYRVARVLLKEKLSVLRQAVVGGQYEFERGVYFGGHDFEPQKAILETGIGARMKTFQSVLILDLHTGYGDRGQLYLFPSDFPNAEVEAATRKVFEGERIEDAHGKDFYANSGDFPEFLSKVAYAQHVLAIPMCLEFGTANNISTYGGIESLRRMVAENEMHWHGSADPATAQALHDDFLEMYFPSTDGWRRKVMELAAQQIPHYIQKFRDVAPTLH